MNISETLIIGIITGIITSLVLYLATTVFKRIVIPWYRVLIYNGIDLNGEWIGYKEFDNGIIQNYLFIVEQNDTNLSATMTLTKRNNKNNNQEIKTYKYIGDIRDRFIAITGRNINKKSIGINTALFEVQGDGTILKGGVVYYNISKNKISQYEFELTRKEKPRTKAILNKGFV